NAALLDYQRTHEATSTQLDAVKAQLDSVKDDQAFWEQMASEAEIAKTELAAKLDEAQAASSAQSPAALAALVSASTAAAGKVHLDEAETRELIDEQLRQAGWSADSATLRYA